MAVYFKDNPQYLKEAIESLLNQSVLPNEIIIVKDGGLNKELDLVLENFSSKNKGLFKIVPLKKNVGLGLALKEGVKHCTYDLIARMDSDDICLRNRFERQLSILKKNKNVSIVGGLISEFNDSIAEKMKIRIVPKNDDEIKKYFKIRNPMNHVSVMIRKSDLLKVGSYKDFYQHEDYYLWGRMIKKGMKFYNIQEVLVYVRVGFGMYGRRGGVKYLRNDIKIQKEFYKDGLITMPEAIKYIMLRIPVRIIPNKIRELIYKKVLRGENENN